MLRLSYNRYNPVYPSFLRQKIEYYFVLFVVLMIKMYQLTDFSDSDNIVIDSQNNIAYFHYRGTSYRDKLKNGLSLEEVYEQDYICSPPNDNIFEIKK